jgi:hypothetical protein
MRHLKRFAGAIDGAGREERHPISLCALARGLRCRAEERQPIVSLRSERQSRVTAWNGRSETRECLIVACAIVSP